MPASRPRHGCAAWLEDQGRDVLLTFEPGDTHGRKDIRRIVLDPATGDLDDRTEALLYAADKAEHVEKVVLPGAGAGRVVITDRYVDSSLAYQGAGRSLDPDELERVLRWATGDLRPHLTVLLDLEPDDGLSRFEERDRIEGESIEFHRACARVPAARRGRPGPLPRPRRPRPGRGDRRGGARARDEAVPARLEDGRWS